MIELLEMADDLQAQRLPKLLLGCERFALSRSMRLCAA